MTINTCSICGGPMKPLAFGSYCPNDCDRKPQVTEKTKLPTDIAWAMISPKIPKAARDVLSRFRRFDPPDNQSEWFVWMNPVSPNMSTNGWMLKGYMTFNEMGQADLIIRINGDGSIDIVKSRAAYTRISDIPDAID